MAVNDHGLEVLKKSGRDLEEDGRDYALQVYDTKSIIPHGWDAVTYEYPSATVEVLKYRRGGANGTTLATVTITYMDSTKARIASIERS